MNRREFVSAAAGTIVVGVNATHMPASPLPHEPTVYVVNGQEPKMIFDVTTGDYHGQRCYSQNYFYEKEMPPPQNHAELAKLMNGYVEYQEWFNKANPPDRPCWAWEDRDYKFDFDRMKTLIEIETRPFVWFVWQRPGRINLMFAGRAEGRFEYKGTASDQAWTTYASGKPTRIWIDGQRHDVIKSGMITHWTNQPPITQWIYDVEKHLPSR